MLTGRACVYICDGVQACLSQSEEDREAAGAREAAAAAQVASLRQDARAAEEKLEHAMADLEVIKRHGKNFTTCTCTV